MFPYKLVSAKNGLLFTLFFLSLSGLSFASDQATFQEKPVIVASTSMISSLVRDIGENQFKVFTLLPPNSCPGHFDLKPKDVQHIRKAVLIISHQYQKDLQKVLQSHVKEVDRWLILPDVYTLTIPEHYLQMGRFFLNYLGNRFPSRESSLKKQWLQTEMDIRQTTAEFKKEFTKKKSFSCPLVVAYHQKDFVGYWGFNLIGVFDSPEGDSMQQLKELIRKGEKAGVQAVIGNLQTGGKQAEVISEKIKVPMVSLSNFPGGEPGTSTYKDLLRSNCSKLLKIFG